MLFKLDSQSHLLPSFDVPCRWRGVQCRVQCRGSSQDSSAAHQTRSCKSEGVGGSVTGGTWLVVGCRCVFSNTRWKESHSRSERDLGVYGHFPQPARCRIILSGENEVASLSVSFNTGIHCVGEMKNTYAYTLWAKTWLLFGLCCFFLPID